MARFSYPLSLEVRFSFTFPTVFHFFLKSCWKFREINTANDWRGFLTFIQQGGKLFVGNEVQKCKNGFQNNNKIFIQNMQVGVLQGITYRLSYTKTDQLILTKQTSISDNCRENYISPRILPEQVLGSYGPSEFILEVYCHRACL